jgi:serine/threonine-protein kinase
MPVELVTGAVIAGRYQLDRALGQGGMGMVWAATHLVTRKRLALKFLKGPAHLRPELRKRFLREARAASAVSHPNLLEVSDVFDLEDGTPVMVMALLEGETLGQRLKRQGALSLQETADVLMQVVSGVGTAHSAGIIHRDLKPDNVFLVNVPGAPPLVRVLDFGIAKLVEADGIAESGLITGTGSMLGTPCYMSPEQTFGEKDVDSRADVWAVGVILYECLTGARPVEGDSVGQVVKRLLSDGIAPIEVLAPSLPPEVSGLVGRLLRRDREERPRDLHEVSRVLARYATVKPPEFGEVRAPSSQDPLPLSDRESVASAPTQAAPSGQGTENPHTVSYARSGRRTPRALWVPVAIAAIVVAVVMAMRTPSGTEPAVHSATAVAAKPVETPVMTPPTQVGAPQPLTPAKANVTAPSATVAPGESEPATSAEAMAASSAKPIAGRHAVPGHAVASAAASPSTTPAVTAPPAAPPPTPASTRVGGLAVKPPF